MGEFVTGKVNSGFNEPDNNINIDIGMELPPDFTEQELENLAAIKKTETALNEANEAIKKFLELGKEVAANLETIEDIGKGRGMNQDVIDKSKHDLEEIGQNIIKEVTTFKARYEQLKKDLEVYDFKTNINPEIINNINQLHDLVNSKQAEIKKEINSLLDPYYTDAFEI